VGSDPLKHVFKIGVTRLSRPRPTSFGHPVGLFKIVERRIKCCPADSVSALAKILDLCGVAFKRLS